MNIKEYPNFNKVADFIKNCTEIISFPLIPEIHLRVLTGRSKLYYSNESEFTRYGISDPFFLFCWPGGQALSRFIIDNREIVKGKRVLVIGIGCGVEGIASVIAGSRYVLGSDVDINALVSSFINMEINKIKFDLTDRDFIFSSCNNFDVILAGDMFYDYELVDSILNWLKELKDNGKMVLCADPSRGRICPEKIEILGEYEVIKDGEIISGLTVNCKVFTIK